MIYLFSLILFMILSLYQFGYPGPAALAVYAFFSRLNYTNDKPSPPAHFIIYITLFNLLSLVDGSMPDYIYNSISISLILLHHFSGSWHEKKRPAYLLLPTALIFVIILGWKYILLPVLVLSQMNHKKNTRYFITVLLLVFLYTVDWNQEHFNIPLKSALNPALTLVYLLYITFLSLDRKYHNFDLIFYSLIISVYISVIISLQTRNLILLHTAVIFSVIFDQKKKEPTNES